MFRHDIRETSVSLSGVTHHHVTRNRILLNGQLSCQGYVFFKGGPLYQHPVRSLVGLIRRRRLQWLGRVLRERRDSLVGRCVMEAAQQSKKGDGSVFQDVPGWVEVQELVEAAEDGGWWKELMDSV